MSHFFCSGTCQWTTSNGGRGWWKSLENGLRGKLPTVNRRELRALYFLRSRPCCSFVILYWYLFRSLLPNSRRYKKLGFSWWRESERFLKFYDANRGVLAVEGCPCQLAKTGDFSALGRWVDSSQGGIEGLEESGLVG